MTILFRLILIACMHAWVVRQVLILLIISDKEHGGHKMNGNSIGICFLVAGTVEILYQVIKLDNYYSYHS